MKQILFIAMLYIFPCHLHAQMFAYKHDNNGNIISRTAQKPIDTTPDDLSDRTIDDKFIDVGISQENDKIIVEFTRSLDNEAEVNLYDTSSKLITKKHPQTQDRNLTAVAFRMEYI